ncbi:hypothetical protein [[Clostridium] scindens]
MNLSIAFGFFRKHLTLLEEVLVVNQNSLIPRRSLGLSIAFVTGYLSSSI